MSQNNLFVKDPNATLDYVNNWADWLSEGDSIIASTWAISSGGNELVIDSSTFLATSATVWLSAGLLGQTYVVTNTITTAQGRVEDGSLRIRMGEK